MFIRFDERDAAEAALLALMDTDKFERLDHTSSKTFQLCWWRYIYINSKESIIRLYSANVERGISNVFTIGFPFVFFCLAGGVQIIVAYY